MSDANPPQANDNNWDLTKEAETIDDLDRASLRDLDHKREEKRGQIALYLIYVLAFTVFISLIRAFMTCQVSEYKEILEIVFSPVVGLVGTATGFYFGEKVSKG